MNLCYSKMALVFGISAAIVASRATAMAGLPPDQRCETGKLKAVASYASCRLKADVKGITKNAVPDYSGCVDKIDSKFPNLEEQAGPNVCPSEMDLADIKDRSDDFGTAIATLLSGETLPTASCGDGIVSLAEQCDVGTLNGETCASRGFFNGTLLCGPGCNFDTSQCNPTRFEDTGNTVIDHQTGLEWEKKTGSNGIANASDAHDADNTYTWAASGASTNTTRTGTVYTDFLAKLNGITNTMTITTSGCYDNACDWRIPTVDELKSIAVPGCGSPACVVDPALLPMRSGRYWSDSSRDGVPQGAYFLDYSTGNPAGDIKTTAYFVRAVRSAS